MTLGWASLVSASLLLSTAVAQHYTVELINGTTVSYTVTEDTGADRALAQKHFDWPFLPYKADSGDGPRGTMQGYNICNKTTLGPESQCVTSFINSIDDFCLWGAPGESELVENVEGEMVAYCTSPNYGTRVLPAGALQGVQFTKTPGYVQVVGFVDQTALNLQPADTGGEEDPHGADSRGNPLGSLMYSSSFGAGPASPYQQVIEWSYFVGGGRFCFKACDPAGPQAARLCEHVYDRIGCDYNAPADYAAINGTFTSCQGENQLPVGVYRGSNGQLSTWYQPPEDQGPITSVGYTPVVPASSQCSTYTSSALFTEVTSATTPSASSAASSDPTSTGPATTSGASNQAADNSSSDAAQLAKITISGLLAAAAAFALL